MRGSERPPAADLAAAELAGNGSNHRHFERFARLKRRKDTRKAGGKKRLARARGAAHQQIMPAGCGDLERALGDLLSLDLRKVRAALGRLGIRKLWFRAQARALEVRQEREQVGRRDHVELASPARLASLRRRANQALVDGRGVDRRQQDAWRAGDAPVQAELADRHIVRQSLRIRGADRRKQAERDRKIIMRPFLRQVGWREIDRDHLGRKGKADRGQRSPHALAAFAHRIVG